MGFVRQGRGGFAVRVERDREMKAAAFTRRAVRAEASAHQPHHSCRDREPESRAAVLSRDRRVGLEEGLEQAIPRLRTHADTRVANGKPQARTGGVVGFEIHRDFDFALARELHCVRQQIEQHLAEPVRVAQETIGHVLAGTPDEREVLRLRGDGDRADALQK